MRRPPVLATLVVALAVATMLWLGVWQLQRGRWKEQLLASYQAAEGKPSLAGLPAAARRDPDAVAFRRVTLACVPEDPAIQIGGRNARGATGYRTIRACRLAKGGRLMLDQGWAPPGDKAAPLADAAPVTATGRLIPDPQLAARLPRTGAEILPLLLVAETPAPGYQSSVAPSIADIPNNHRGYAVQWFLFAAVAFTVYLLALRRRRS